MKEQTLILAKPDAVQRGIVGEIIQRFEKRGLKLVGLKLVKPTPAHIAKHYLPTKEQLEGMGNKTLESFKKYGKDPVKEMGSDNPYKIGEIIHKWNIEFLSSGPVVAMVFEGLHAVEMSRKIVGSTIPANADLGTIRGDFSVDSPALANKNKRTVRNIVHASGSIPEAKREISHWFSKKEIFSYKRADEDTIF